MKQKRIDKVNKLIQKKLSSMINNQVIKPTNNIITIANVETNLDLSQSKVFITTLKEEKKIISTLNNISKTLRTKLSKEIKIYKIPKLIFILENKTTYAKEIIEIFENE